MPSAPSTLVAACALLACAPAHAERPEGVGMSRSVYSANVVRSFDPASLLSGCLYEGRWYASGAIVPSRSSCLRCICTRSALTCRRRTCLPLPDLPPKLCHVKHSRDSCCPEMHCPDGVRKTEKEENDSSDIDQPTTIGHACVEGGTIYAGGSAMTSKLACEECFCMKGMKQCVTPTCISPPPHCVPRPTSGACCPQRYYCEHSSSSETVFDCEVDDKIVREGERVETSANCTACFCLKGVVKCRELDCAPPLHGCEPILRAGECCAHQYKCENKKAYYATKEPDVLTAPQVTTSEPKLQFRPRTQPPRTSTVKAITRVPPKTALKQQVSFDYNRFSNKSDHRAVHYPKQTGGRADFLVRRPVVPNGGAVINTNKVKRKVSDEFLTFLNISKYDINVSTQDKSLTEAKQTNTTVDVKPLEFTTTEQPEGTVKIVINGTINCTAELSSTSLPLSFNVNDTEKIKMEAMPRIPIVNVIEAQTFSPNDIITDRSVNGDFDENDTFIINVTSSLNTNTSRPTMISAARLPTPLEIVDSVNSSKNIKGDDDYDYTEPTLPPSLPNLKIIPFVAADAVVDDITSKEPLTYPILEREDKFPVYYSTSSEDRREDKYKPTQYPVFVSENNPDYSHDVDHNMEVPLANSNRHPVRNVLVHEYTMTSSLGSHANDRSVVTKAPVSSSTYEQENSAVNLFSPPAETQGGFVPKTPGIIEEYFPMYTSTPSVPAVPHLTTSMQLDITKSECLSEDGIPIPEGESMMIECRECTCSWGLLSCKPRACQAPPGCEFVVASGETEEECCGSIVCDAENETTTTTRAPVTVKDKVNKSKPDIALKRNTTMISNQSAESTKILQNNFSPVNVTSKKNNKNQLTEKQTTTTPTTLAIISTNKVLKTTSESAPVTTPATSTTTANTSSSTVIPKAIVTTTNPPTTTHQVNDREYEDEDEEEEFSFGSVLQLLLSDNYASTTTNKPKTKAPQPPINSTSRPPSNVSILIPTSTVNPFKPLPVLPFLPPKMSPITLNRIDHLVLGEATAIKRTTPRPITNKSTKTPTERDTERTEADLEFPSSSRPPNINLSSNHGLSGAGIGAGILKLAGCNIYGRMYRVGRIITELSTPCQQCWCTEVGVQCKPLKC